MTGKWTQFYYRKRYIIFSWVFLHTRIRLMQTYEHDDNKPKHVTFAQLYLNSLIFPLLFAYNIIITKQIKGKMLLTCRAHPVSQMAFMRSNSFLSCQAFFILLKHLKPTRGPKCCNSPIWLLETCFIKEQIPIYSYVKNTIKWPKLKVVQSLIAKNVSNINWFTYWTYCKAVYIQTVLCSVLFL